MATNSNVSDSTVKRFLAGKPIRVDNFISICNALGLENDLTEWLSVADCDSTRVSQPTAEKLISQNALASCDSASEQISAKYRLSLTASFDPADVEEIEGAIVHLSKLLSRGSYTISNSDREIKHQRFSS